MSHGLDEVLYDFQLRAFGEELTRVNQLPVQQRRAYIRSLWESRVQRSVSTETSFVGTHGLEFSEEISEAERQ
jgi:hypothetical protein